MTELQKKFLSSFPGNIEISNAKSVCEISDNENIYFLSWVKSKDKRNDDNDILVKSSFVIDLDIRSYFREKEKIEIEDEEIKDIAKTLSEFLKNAKYWLDKWRYIIFSWNWLHIYYIGEEVENLNPKYYSLWVKKYYELFEEYIDCEYMIPDYACRNLARIMRLPDTINQKNFKRVEILYEQDCNAPMIKSLCEVWKKYESVLHERQKEEAKKKIKEYETSFRMNALTYGEDWTKNKWKLEEKIAKINWIPAYLVSMALLPEFTFHHNQKNFLNEKWEYTWFFYNDKTNTICNWWSHHYAWWDANSCYSPLILVHKFFWHSNWRDTFLFFTNNFKIYG